MTDPATPDESPPPTGPSSGSPESGAPESGAPESGAPQSGPEYRPFPPVPDYTPLPPTSEAEARALARKRVEAKRSLSAHAVTYLVVNLFLIGVWAVTSPGGYFWPGWVLGGWGVGLALNAWDVLLRKPITEADIDRELGRG